MSLRQRLVLIIGSQVVLSALVAVGAVAVVSNRSAQARSTEQLGILSDRADATTATEVARLEVLAAGLARDQALRAHLAAEAGDGTEGWLSLDLPARLPADHFVEIRDADGHLLYSSRDNGPWSCAPESGVQVLRPSAGGLPESESSGVPILVGAAPLLDPTGRYAGTVVVGRTMDLAYLRMLSSAVGQTVSLWGADGTSIASTSRTLPPDLAGLVGARDLTALALGRRVVGRTELTPAGDLSCVWGLSRDPGTAPAAYLGIAAPAVALVRPDWATISIVGAAAALCIALTFLTTVAVGGRVARDMEVLVASTRAVGHGNLETRVNEAGLREMGVLGAAFNEMAEALDHSTGRLRESETRLLRANVATRRAYEDALASLAAALDTRDSETREHSYRVMEFSLRLARELRLPDEALVYVERGALLHDIGKIGIPDSILLKPSQLSHDEWAVMRTHPRIGFSMLASVNFLASAAEIIYAHHERWDGSGYPRGLAGEQIPLGARIFAVADAFDAMTSDRPYRRALPYQAASDAIREGSGKHFDPTVVEAFLSVSEEEWDALREDVSVFVAAQRDRVAKRILEFDLQSRRLSAYRPESDLPRFLRVS